MVQITLEGTLADFFRAEDARNGTTSIPCAFICYNLISDIDLVPWLPHENRPDRLPVFNGLKEDLTETSAVIDAQYRFQAEFCSSLEHVERAVGASLAMPFLPVDAIAHLPHHFDLDLHYKLQSKRALALSGLSTPNAQLVDFRSPHLAWDSETLEQEIGRVADVIRTRHTPFVLKSNSSGSKGVYIIRTSEDQHTIL
ncbi:hypothetical protein NUW58_g1613 [Xylaria curta]|uniref:Uncharacterized protein n=1 Tax=Xylaria curta TaxID=42375 RepID=A0ACC1PLY6_9PEZI|nr:hypothetical protein NUW58_g1613 [Xylaria curta]